MAARQTTSEQPEVPMKWAAWAAWLTAALARRGWQQSDLIKAAGVDADGKPVLSTSRVSQWCAGQQKASPDKAVFVAEVIGEDPADALDSINEPRIAAAMRAGRAGSSAASERRQVDEVLATLRASDLPAHQKRKFEDEYAEMVGPMIQATEALRRRLAAEMEQALKAQAARQAEGSSGEEAAAN